MFTSICPGNYMFKAIAGGDDTLFYAPTYYYGQYWWKDAYELSVTTKLANIEIPLNDPLGMEEYNSNGFTIYPNPTKDIIQIVPSFKSDYDVVLMDVVGKPLFQSQNVRQLDLSNWNNGVYLLQLSKNDQTFTRRVSRF